MKVALLLPLLALSCGTGRLPTPCGCLCFHCPTNVVVASSRGTRSVPMTGVVGATRPATLATPTPIGDEPRGLSFYAYDEATGQWVEAGGTNRVKRVRP